MADPDPQTPSPSRPPEEPRRRTAAPLLWIVLLLALLAFGWFVYNERSGMGPAPEALPPPPVAIGDGQDAAAERERAADDARRASREARAAGQRERTPAAPPASAGPDREASPLARVEPEYPVEAYRRREEGTVLVGASVGVDGRPVRVDVIRRSGSRALDQAAADAVRQWTFEPAVRGGRKVAADVEVPVTFRIDR